MSANPEPTIDQLRDLRDYLVTIPSVLRNEATRHALGKLRVIIGEAANPPPPPESKGLDEQRYEISETHDQEWEVYVASGPKPGERVCLCQFRDIAEMIRDVLNADARRLRAGAEGGDMGMGALVELLEAIDPAGWSSDPAVVAYKLTPRLRDACAKAREATSRLRSSGRAET